MAVVKLRVVSPSMLLLVLTCTVSLTMRSVSAKLHNVGGSKVGWKENVNYTEWSMNEQFFVGDWLYFGYLRAFYNVLEVNKTDYETCRSDRPIFNVTGGAGRDVFQLIEAKTYYFLSSGGYCYHGMRVSVLVQDIIPVQAPSPPKNSSPSDSGNQPIVLAIAIAWTLLKRFWY